MATVQCVAIVQESDYSKLAPLCVHSVSGDDYAAFLEKVEEHCKELEAIGVTPVKVNIDPTKFAAWLRRASATRADLASYAAIVSTD
jgi:Asp-tRNA(Asn)/Glu-tRNA(Gln) amidotransferase C subunit